MHKRKITLLGNSLRSLKTSASESTQVARSVVLEIENAFPFSVAGG